MKKTKLIALITGFVVTCLSFSVHAEFMLGLQGGFSSSQGEAIRTPIPPTLPGVDRLPNEGGGSALGLFGQYRHTRSNNVILGVHLGYTADSAEWKRSFDGSRLAVPVDRGSLGYKADNVYDVLGLVGYRGQKITPFVMFGFSNMKVKGSWVGEFQSMGDPTTTAYNDSANATLTGWKLATGVEFPFSDKLVGHVLLHYADYGKATFTLPASSPARFTPRTLEVKQTGIRFGIGYKF